MTGSDCGGVWWGCVCWDEGWLRLATGELDLTAAAAVAAAGDKLITGGWGRIYVIFMQITR